LKGIILAGGAGSRLHPITKSISKQLLPVYDKPMIFYPLSSLMLGGIREILIITTPEQQYLFENLLGDGADFGIQIKYEVQLEPNGIAEAFIIGEDFIGEDECCLILGDNLFFGHDFSKILIESIYKLDGATIFAYEVNDPERYGVVAFNKKGEAISIEEKPTRPKSNYAVTGLYLYTNEVVKIAKQIKPSSRGEKEISEINDIFLKNNSLKVTNLGRGFAWLDTGTFDSLLEASQFVQTIENRQGYKIACLEEISWRNGWISNQELLNFSKLNSKNSYGPYLESLLRR